MASQTEQTSFLFAQNASFIADLYARFKRDPGQVDASWATFFGSLGDDAEAMLGDLNGPSWAPRNGHGGNGAVAEAPSAATPAPPVTAPVGGLSEDQLKRATLDSIRALMLIRAYRVRGHLDAKLDPLGLKAVEPHPELDPEDLWFHRSRHGPPDLHRQRAGPGNRHPARDRRSGARHLLRSIGVEFMHIQDPTQKAWIQERIEGDPQPDRLHR